MSGLCEWLNRKDMSGWPYVGALDKLQTCGRSKTKYEFLEWNKTLRALVMISKIKVVAILCLVVAHLQACSSPSKKMSLESENRMINSAPLRNASTPSWNRYFSRNKWKITPEIVVRVIEKSIDGVDEPEQIAAQLSRMGISNTIFLEGREYGGIPTPRITFKIKKLHRRRGVFTTRDLGGYILIEIGEHAKRVYARYRSTGL